MTVLLKHPSVGAWRGTYPASEVTECLRVAVEERRRMILQRGPGAPDTAEGTLQAVVERAGELLSAMTAPRVTRAINATGILLHTGLGRAVFASTVVDDLLPELKGCCTLAVNRATGDRAERDELLEPLLARLTGAEAGTVVNNNAAATLLVLAGLAAGREVIVSRGQLVEIGGSFRLPEVMAESGARLVEVGATNRTHLRDYERAITANTAAILRVHPSNYRIVGFTNEVPLADLVALARARGVMVWDDLGAGALVDLRRFGLPYEPTVQESMRAGADLAFFSGDKLIGASQAGLIVGRRDLIHRLRKHPLMRALRVDKTCLLILERTLRLFCDPERLAVVHPTYQMLSTSLETLRARAESLRARLAVQAPQLETRVTESVAFLGSGAVPAQGIPSMALQISHAELSAEELARRLRMEPVPVFGRIEADALVLDMRTVREDEADVVAEALVGVVSP